MEKEKAKGKKEREREHERGMNSEKKNSEKYTARIESSDIRELFER